MRVVLAEDSAPTRRLLAAEIERCGHQVDAVADGGAAWAAFERDRPPLVILDWLMPVLDGAEVCRRIRASAAGGDTFVLMVTSLDAEGDLASALDSGVDDYLTKPVSPEQFRARLVIAERRIELAAARRRAEDALARATWLAGVGETTLAVQHEINNPLAAVFLHLDLAAACHCPPELREHLDGVSQQVHRIANVVKRLSDVHERRTVEAIPGAHMLDLSRNGSGD